MAGDRLTGSELYKDIKAMVETSADRNKSRFENSKSILIHLDKNTACWRSQTSMADRNIKGTFSIYFLIDISFRSSNVFKFDSRLISF